MALRRRKSKKSQVVDLLETYLKLQAAKKATKGARKAAKGTAVYKVAKKTPIVRRIPIIVGTGNDRDPLDHRRALGHLVDGGALRGLPRALGRLLGGLELEVGLEQVDDLALLALASSECHAKRPTRGPRT